MQLVDLMVVAVIVAGIAFMVYRTMWKTKSPCPGCEGGSCSSTARPAPDTHHGCCDPPQDGER